jgi:threonine dehydrogenase-like Zn-dependent dehydrogenase
MTAALQDGGGGALSLKILEQRLKIKDGHRVAVINAPRESGLRLSVASRQNPDQADVVIGFAARPVDLTWLKAAFAAARAGRLAWVSYPKPGRPGTDLHRGWLVRALRQYGVGAVEEVSVDDAWSALQLRSVRDSQQEQLD